MPPSPRPATPFSSSRFDGKRYSHIVDPQTGLGLVDRSSVTLLARNCTIADSYTKAVAVLGPEKGLKLIDETPGAAAIVVRVPQGKVETYESKRSGRVRIRRRESGGMNMP